MTQEATMGQLWQPRQAKKRRELRCCLRPWHVGLEQPFSIWVP